MKQQQKNCAAAKKARCGAIKRIDHLLNFYFSSKFIIVVIRLLPIWWWWWWVKSSGTSYWHITKFNCFKQFLCRLACFFYVLQQPSPLSIITHSRRVCTIRFLCWLDQLLSQIMFVSNQWVANRWECTFIIMQFMLELLWREQWEASIFIKINRVSLMIKISTFSIFL